MDIQALKIDLVKRILNTQNRVILSEISKLLETEAENDWWDQLPKEIQDSIFEGIKDIGEGKVFTHDQVIREAKQKYGF